MVSTNVEGQGNLRKCRIQRRIFSPADHHGGLCFRKVGHSRKLQPKPKHPPKVHVWAGISKRGATAIVIFTGTLTSTRYCDILQNTLVLFVRKVFPNGHRFQQDNDPKHTSNYTKDYLARESINW